MQKQRSRNPELKAFGAYLERLRGKRSRASISIQLEKLGVKLGGSTLAQYERGTVWAPDAGVLWGLSVIYRHPLHVFVSALLTNRADPDLIELHPRDLTRHGAAATSSLSKGDTVADLAAATRTIEQLEHRLSALEGIATEAQSIATRLLKLAVRDGETAEARTPQSESRRGARTAGD